MRYSSMFYMLNGMMWLSVWTMTTPIMLEMEIGKANILCPLIAVFGFFFLSWFVCDLEKKRLAESDATKQKELIEATVKAVRDDLLGVNGVPEAVADILMKNAVSCP